MGSGNFQVNELHARKLEEIPPADTLPKKNDKSLKCQKITLFQSNIFSSLCIDKFILIPGRYLIILSKI